jgi:hypothetical protein
MLLLSGVVHMRPSQAAEKGPSAALCTLFVTAADEKHAAFLCNCLQADVSGTLRLASRHF